MNFFLIPLLFLMQSYVFGTETKLSSQGQSTLEVIPNTKIFCIAEENLASLNITQKLDFIPAVNSTRPKFIQRLICYKCCVAEKNYTKKSCENIGFKNYGKGKNCSCN